MTIKLITPHSKQKEIVNACLDSNVMFIVAIIGRQFGKTTIAENISIYWALNTNKSIIYWVSPTDSQCNKVYKEIINAIIESGCVKSHKGSKGDTEIVFKSGSKILFRSAASEDSLRGQSVDYMILDESAFIKKEVVETILLPMLSVRGKKCLFISTPKGKNYLFDYFQRGHTDSNWKSLRFSTYDSPFVNDSIIDMFKKTLPEKLFKQEIEAEFIDSSSIFNNISEVMLLSELDKPIIGQKYFAGIDIGFVNDASVLSIVDSDGNLVKYYRWENIESPELIDEIIKINSIWNFEKMLIENNNQGLVVFQSLKRVLSNIYEFNTNSKTKPEIINNLIFAFNSKSIKIINDDYLRIELESFIFKQNDSGRLSFMADYGFHDDCVISFAIARYCWQSFEKYNQFDYEFYIA